MLRRWFAVALCVAALFRLYFDVMVWPSVLLLTVGIIVIVGRGRNATIWVIATSLLFGGLFGILAGDEWQSLRRAEPLGRTAQATSILVGVMMLLFVKRETRRDA